MATALSLAGLAASGWLLSADLAYPGLPALLPTVATALFIAAGTDGTALGRRIATWKPGTFPGDISCALYACHWPIIVF
jgi:peptidoglycan/LPS O-acetylase OafA/YrhL